MNRELARKWSDAAKSGRYTQGLGCLSQQTPEGEVLCFSGVLADVLVNEGIGFRWEKLPSAGVSRLIDDEGFGSAYSLPDRVCLLMDMSEDMIAHLQECNDNGVEFDALAKALDKLIDDPALEEEAKGWKYRTFLDYVISLRT